MRFFVTDAADARKEIERSLMDPVWKINDCIIELYLVHDDSIRNELKTVIASQIKPVQAFRGKYPTSKQFYKWTYHKKHDLIADRAWMKIAVENTEFKYELEISTPIDKICDDVDRICHSYYMWVANELSKTGRIVAKRACVKLDELLAQFN